MTYVGIDVGGPVKGYHALALRDGDVLAKFHSCDSAAVARWCIEQNAAVVAVDAPCRWRVDGELARAAERELARDRISCFSTPTEAKATGHSFYTWMVAGHQLYAALAATHPVWMGEAMSGHSSAVSSSGPHLSTCPVSFNFHPSTFNRHPVSIETFPQAVACALAGEIVSAHRKHKRLVRLGILQRAMIDISALKSVDEIDAALCALAAARFADGAFKAYGDCAGGFIVVPKTPLAAVIPGAPDSPVHSESPAFKAIRRRLPHLSSADRQQLRARLDGLEHGL